MSPAKDIPAAPPEPAQAVERILARPSPRAQRACLGRLLAGMAPEESAALAEALKERAVASLGSDIPAAQQCAALLFSLARRTGREEQRALALRVRAQVLSLGLGEHRRALPYFRRALAIHRRRGERLGQALVYLTYIWALANTGHYQQAAAAGEWAAQVFQEAGEWQLYARLQNNLSTIHNHAWQFERALACTEAAINAYEQLGETRPIVLASNQGNRAYTLSLLGRFEEAIQASQQTLVLAQIGCEKIIYARTQHHLAIIYILLGQYNQALDLLLQARDAHAQVGQPHEAALCTMNITDCLLELNRPADALEQCVPLIPLFEHHGLCREAAEVAYDQARACLRLGRLREAIAALGSARRIFEQERLPHWAVTDMEIAQLHLRLGEPGQALPLVENCLAGLEKMETTYEAVQARLAAAEALLQLGQAERAGALLEDGLAAAGRHAWPALLFQGRLLRARGLRAAGRLPAALDEFEQAMQALEQLRSQVMLEFRAGFLEQHETVYAESIGACLELGQARQALATAERARAQSLRALLAGGADLRLRARRPADQPLVEHIQALQAERRQLTSYLGRLALDPAERGGREALKLQARLLELEKELTAAWHRLLIANAAYAAEAELWAAQPAATALPAPAPGSLLLEYFGLPEGYILFLVEPAAPGGEPPVQAVRLAAAPAELERLQQALQLNLAGVPAAPPELRARLEAGARKLLRRLYELLLAPAADVLTRYERLVIVPHGPLHYLPFQALHDGAHYLLETHALRYLPAAHLAQAAPPVPAARGGLLAVGHSFHGALPGAPAEARAIARLWRSFRVFVAPKRRNKNSKDSSPLPFQGRGRGRGAKISPIRHSTLLLEQRAGLARVTRLAEGCRLLHLACHAEFRADNPLFSGLALEDGWLTTLEIFNLRLNAALVTLSACQTGRSAGGGGDELAGLMRAFLAAGAQSLVLSQWPVSDEVTAGLMQSFYRGLARGEERAAALRRAQRELLAGPQAHPYYWAPFYLVGADGPV